MKTAIRLLVSVMVWMLVPAMIQSSQVKSQDYVKSDFRVSEISDFFYKGPHLSVNSAGEMVVVWETTGSGNIWFKTISSRGAVISEQKLVPGPNSTMEPRVAYSGNGNFMVMYGGFYSSWSVFGQLYDPDGNEIGDTLELQRNTSEMMNMNYSSIYADQDSHFGAFLSGMDSMMIEKITVSGEFAGSAIVLKPEPPATYMRRGIMTRSGNIILVWSTGFGTGELRGQSYTQEGIPIGDSFLVGEIEGSSTMQDFALAADHSGNFAVVWSIYDGSKSEIYSQLFTSEGAPVGSNTLISEEQSKYEVANGEISIDMDEDGKSVIAWSDTRGIDTSYIYIQQLDNQGVPVGGNFRATTINNEISPENSALTEQRDPSVRILRDTIYLAWVNSNQDVSNRWDIFASIQKWMVPDVTGLDQPGVQGPAIKVYPNPSSGYFSLKIANGYSGAIDLEVYKLSGSLVWKAGRYLSGQEADLDLSGLPEGLYYLRISGASIHSIQPLNILK